MDLTHRGRNDAARARLAALVERLRPEDLDRPLGGGWTVKAALAHLAFWDRFDAATVQQWQREGYSKSGDDDTFINIAALDDWLAAPAEYVLCEVLRAAEAADRIAAGIDDALRAAITAGGETWAFERGAHRVEHIEQIERALMNES
jgi:hypothetical protein